MHSLIKSYMTLHIIYRDESCCWRWEYSIDVCLMDDSEEITASVTSTAMEVWHQYYFGFWLLDINCRIAYMHACMHPSHADAATEGCLGIEWSLQ